jgi:2-polyprenyl-3-methyl-5-hydroxy-6-metoxy-1,4-benzoquinol methylase
MEELKNCPLCHSSEISKYLSVIDHSVSKEQFRLEKCSQCGLIFTNPRPEANQIDRYYESPDYISHTDSNTGLLNNLYKIARGFSLRWKGSQISQHINTQGAKLLDIGCGTGDFLLYCKKNGFICQGIEPNDGARKIAEKKIESKIHPPETIFYIESSSFDIITMWHVLEHVDDLNKYVASLFNILNPGGYCFIAIPNPSSYDSVKYGKNWAAYDVPRHLSHFYPDTVKYLFKQNSFSFVKAVPMKLDAFYISLLSEKYKRGGSLSLMAYLDAIVTGAKSNFKADSAEKYSSVLYIFTKPS